MPVFRNRVSDDSLLDFFHFMLEDVQVFSWDTKQLEVLEVDDDEVERLVTVDFPGLTRKRSPEVMYSAFATLAKSSSREYDNHSIKSSPRAPDDPLGRR